MNLEQAIKNYNQYGVLMFKYYDIDETPINNPYYNDTTQASLRMDFKQLFNLAKQLEALAYEAEKDYATIEANNIVKNFTNYTFYLDKATIVLTLGLHAKDDFYVAIDLIDHNKKVTSKAHGCDIRCTLDYDDERYIDDNDYVYYGDYEERAKEYNITWELPCFFNLASYSSICDIIEYLVKQLSNRSQIDFYEVLDLMPDFEECEALSERYCAEKWSAKSFEQLQEVNHDEWFNSDYYEVEGF